MAKIDDFIGSSGVTLVTSVVGFAKRRRAKKKLKKARVLKRVQQQTQFARARANFIQNARQQQARALVAQAATGASLDSSASRGIQSSIQTQETANLGEFTDLTRLDRRIAGLVQSASNDISDANFIEGVGQTAQAGINEFRG